MANIKNRMAGQRLGCKCGNAKEIVDAESGETVCPGCGVVLLERTETRLPNVYNREDPAGKNRSQGPGTTIIRHDMGLYTTIGNENRDASGKPLASSMKTTMEKLRTWDNRSQTHNPGKHGLKKGLMELNRLKDKMAVSGSIAERAAYIYRKAAENGLVKGRSITAVMAAALYIACREAGTARTLKDMETASNAKRRDIARYYRCLVKEMDMKMPVVDAIQCVARIASMIGIAEKTKRHAVDIIRHVQKHGISAGKDPMALAAGALYMAGIMNGENKTQREIARSANVTDVPIRNQCRHIRGLADCAASCSNST